MYVCMYVCMYGVYVWIPLKCVGSAVSMLVCFYSSEHMSHKMPHLNHKAAECE